MGRKTMADFHSGIGVKRTMQVRREEYLDYMTFRENRRPLFTEIFGPLPQLKEEWREQGATPEELDFSAFRYRQAILAHLPVATGWIGGPRPVLLEETDDFAIGLDHYGRRVKLSKRAATLPLPLEYPVRRMDDWLRLKPHYEFSQARLAADWEQAARDHREAGRVVCVGIPGGFDEPRQLLGEEALCVAYYEQPELVHDILATIRDTALRVLDVVSRTVPVDMLMVHEDMAGKNGPLAGPRQVREFIGPYYRAVWDILQDRGARLFGQDSDGDITPVIPAFLDAGLNFMYPMEPAAGVDIVKVREQYGTRLAFMGGIDKFALRGTRDEILAELEYKVPPMVATGGCVLALDHRILNGVPLANYRFYIQKVWEIMDREAAPVL